MRSRDGRVDDSDRAIGVFAGFWIAAQRSAIQHTAGEDLWNLLLAIAINKIRCSAVEFEQSANRNRTGPSPWSQQDAATDIQSHEDSATSFAVCVGEAMERLPAKLCSRGEQGMEGYEVQEIAQYRFRVGSFELWFAFCKNRTSFLREYIGEDHSVDGLYPSRAGRHINELLAKFEQPQFGGLPT